MHSEAAHSTVDWENSSHSPCAWIISNLLSEHVSGAGPEERASGPFWTLKKASKPGVSYMRSQWAIFHGFCTNQGLCLGTAILNCTQKKNFTVWMHIGTCDSKEPLTIKYWEQHSTELFTGVYQLTLKLLICGLLVQVLDIFRPTVHCSDKQGTNYNEMTHCIRGHLVKTLTLSHSRNATSIQETHQQMKVKVLTRI